MRVYMVIILSLFFIFSLFDRSLGICWLNEEERLNSIGLVGIIVGFFFFLE